MENEEYEAYIKKARKEAEDIEKNELKILKTAPIVVKENDETMNNAGLEERVAKLIKEGKIDEAYRILEELKKVNASNNDDIKQNDNTKSSRNIKNHK